MASTTDTLLQAILATVGRQMFPPERLAEIILNKGATDRQRQAFNMCDGTRSQADVVKTLKLDTGNFSRTVARWIEAGILVRIGEGREAKLLHIYPLPEDAGKKRNQKR